MARGQKHIYKPMEAIHYNDGREERLLQFIKTHPGYGEMQGNPENILAAMDEYGYRKDFLMNVGSEKGKVVAEKLIPELRPDVMVELGGYMGYSALLFGSALKKAGGCKYLSLEANPNFAAMASDLIELAGLDDTVEIIVGPCRNSLRKLEQEYSAGVIDIFFIDHEKSGYVNDLKLCEELRLVGPGTTVIADNVVFHGLRDYQEYVRTRTSDKFKRYQKDLMAVSLDQRKDTSLGNPYLVYETVSIDSLEPTGEPDALDISRCIGVEGL